MSDSSQWSSTTRHRRHGRPGGRGGRQTVGLVGRVLAAILSLTLLLAFGYGWWNYRRLNSGLRRVSINVGGAAPAAGSAAPTRTDIDGKDQNILVVGLDDRTGDTPAELKELDTTADGGSLATDTMMIVHIPADGKQATLISLPRDSYVAIPGYGTHKLNSAYADGYTAVGGTLQQKIAAGANMLIQTLEQLTGVTIDHFVEVNLYGFYSISNAIGGVRVDMCQAENDANSGFDQPAGWVTLQGTQALAFVRQRDNLPQGDLSREERQRYFLTAAFRKITTAGVLLDPSKLSKLISAVDGALYVDQNLNLTTLAEQMANLSANNIVGAQIPVGANISTSDGDALQVNPAQVKQFMAALINTDNGAIDSAKALAPSAVTVDVINGSGTNGAAAASAALLRQDGFTVADYTQPSNGEASSTVIEYSTGQEAQAKTLAEYVPGATYQEVDGLSHPTLLLGTDGLSAKYIAPSTAKPGTTTPTPSASPSKSLDSGCIN